MSRYKIFVPYKGVIEDKISDSLSVNLDSGFQIPGVSTIGGFFELNSGCQSPGFHIPPAKTSRIQEFAHPDL